VKNVFFVHSVELRSLTRHWYCRYYACDHGPCGFM